MEEKNIFTWIPLYKELATALLQFKDDRTELVRWIYDGLGKVKRNRNSNRSLVDYLKMEDGSKIVDIDPFSVIAIFNRNVGWEKRTELLIHFKEKFDLKAAVPSDFEGIPTINPMQSFFFNWAEKNRESIRDLWELYENVVLGRDISSSFDNVVEKWIPKYSLTMCLFWICPDKYVALDSRNRSYLETFGISGKFSGRNYQEYTNILLQIKQKMDNGEIPCTSFKELSYNAWILTQTDRLWMFGGNDNTFTFDYLEMGSSAKGALKFEDYKTKETLIDAYRKVVGNKDASIPQMYWKFMHEVKVGDIVVVFDTKKVSSQQYHLLFGWGRICSEVAFKYDEENPIRRNVEWHKPLPVEPVKETMTKNAFFFHDVSGMEAANIKKLLNIDNASKEEMEPKKRYDEYIELLKTNHNLILTGAPGTGKTYLAKEIAKEMGAEFEFVQFHPSYDYTDFVEGLRPVKDVQNGVISFKRQDGVFKQFCKKAILSESVDADTLEEINSNPNVWKVSLEGTGNNPTRTDCLNNGYIRIGWDKYGDIEDFNDFEDFYDGGKNVLRAFQYGMQIGDLVVSCYSAKEVDAVGIITGEYEYRPEGGEYPRYRNVKWLVKNIRENIVEINKNKPFTLSTIYKSNITAKDALEIVKKYSTRVAEVPRADKAVFIIDEINRGEISKIFGELFFSIDPGYRGKAGMVKTQYQNMIEEGDAFEEGFYVPENVYIIGTMNDIDRSVESMDFAMRRRFAWKEVSAEESLRILTGLPYEAEAKARMNRLNEAILKIRGLGKAYQIGAAYFMKIQDYQGDFGKLWEYHLVGLLYEYLRGNNDASMQLEQLKNAYDGIE